MRMRMALLSLLLVGLLGAALTDAQRGAGAQGTQPAAAAQGRGGGGDDVLPRGAFQPPLWASDDQFSRWPYPAGDTAYAKVNGFKDHR